MTDVKYFTEKQIAKVNSGTKDLYNGLKSAIRENDAAGIEKSVLAISQTFISLANFNQEEELEQRIVSEERLHQRFFDVSKRKDPIAYYAGYYSATLTLFSRKLRMQAERELLSERLAQFSGSTRTQFHTILWYLNTHEGIRHGQLANALNIKKNTLTDLMDKLVRADAVVYSRPGKFKYYYLSKAGKEYWRYWEKMISDMKKQININDIVEIILGMSDPAMELGKLVNLVMTRFNERCFPASSLQKLPDSIYNQNVASRLESYQQIERSVCKEQHYTCIEQKDNGDYCVSSLARYYFKSISSNNSHSAGAPSNSISEEMFFNKGANIIPIGGRKDDWQNAIKNRNGSEEVSFAYR